MAAFIVRTGENTLEAARQALLAAGSAEDAAQSAAYAGGFETPEYASQSAGNTATTEGQIFRVPIGTTPQTFNWYRRLSSGSELVDPLATSTYLASSAGAGAVGLADGGSVQNFADRFAFQDDPNGDNVVLGNADINQIASDLNTATIAGGGNSLNPNLIGYLDYYTKIIGDGVTTTFVSTFDVTDTSYVGVFLIRADGVRVQVEDYSTITIVGGKASVAYPQPGHFVNDGPGGAEGANSAVLTTQSIVLVYRVATENLGSGSDYSGIFGSYDNVIQQGIMQHIVSHAHGRITGGDHNLMAGGSYGRKESGSYGICAGGTNYTYAASGSGGGFIGCVGTMSSGTGPVWGLMSGGSISGAFAGAGGANNAVAGNGAWAFGREHSLSAQDAFAGGYDHTISGVYGTAFGLTCTVSSAYGFAYGRGSTASGESAAAGGRDSTASATYTFAHGYQTSITGTSSAGFGYQCSSVGTYNLVAGRSNSIAGSYSAAFGRNHTVTGDWSLATGYGTSCPHDFAHVIGGESFATVGDCQTTVMVARVSTTDATIASMRLGAAAQRITIPDQTTWVFDALIVARRTDADNESAGYRIIGVIDRQTGAGTTSLVGTPTVTVLAEDAAAWDATVQADSTNGALDFRVTGEAGKTIRWVARVTLSEVSG